MAAKNTTANAASHNRKFFCGGCGAWGNDVFDDWGFFYIYDVESGKYSTIKEALDIYLEGWREYNEGLHGVWGI